MKYSHKSLLLIFAFLLICSSIIGCGNNHVESSVIVKSLNTWVKTTVSKSSCVEYNDKDNSYNIKYISSYDSSLQSLLKSTKADKTKVEEVTAKINWEDVKFQLCEFSKIVSKKVEDMGVKDPKVIVTFYDKTGNNYYLQYSNGDLLIDKFEFNN